MIIVSDASPLITIAKIEYLSILEAIFGFVYIPHIVEQELTAKNLEVGIPDILTLAKGWLVVQSPKQLITFPKLDLGESAAISLALELKATSLLIDEKVGRKTALSMGLHIIGTIGILEEAAFQGLIDLEEAFKRLKKQTFDTLTQN
jgi:predicted nucleic acid-binding protein